MVFPHLSTLFHMALYLLNHAVSIVNIDHRIKSTLRADQRESPSDQGENFTDTNESNENDDKLRVEGFPYQKHDGQTHCDENKKASNRNVLSFHDSTR